MRKKSVIDVADIVLVFQSLIKNKPDVNAMYEEIQMMKFKIKPVQGNLSEVNLKNKQFIETLWSLGKLDEFFQREYPKLTPKNKQIFLNIFDDVYQRYQQELNKVNLYQGKKYKENQTLEMEIFRESKNSKKIN